MDKGSHVVVKSDFYLCFLFLAGDLGHAQVYSCQDEPGDIENTRHCAFYLVCAPKTAGHGP